MAEWVQILAQLGALGCLAILCYHVPSMIRALQAWRKESEEYHAAERKELKSERAELLAAYREEAKAEREICRIMNKEMSENLGNAITRVGEAVDQHDKLARQAMKQIDEMVKDKKN